MGGHLGPFRWGLGEDFAGGGAAHPFRHGVPGPTS